MRRPIVLHDVRVLDRDVGRATVEVLDRIAARGHHLLDQLVRLIHGIRGRVHELRLHLRPIGREPVVIGLRERTEIQRAHALAALPEIGLRETAVAGASQRPFVFGAEVPLQPASPGSSDEHPSDHGHHHRGRDHDDPYPRLHRAPPRLFPRPFPTGRPSNPGENRLAYLGPATWEDGGQEDTRRLRTR
jgi:hypothetical protein